MNVVGQMYEIRLCTVDVARSPEIDLTTALCHPPRGQPAAAVAAGSSHCSCSTGNVSWQQMLADRGRYKPRSDFNGDQCLDRLSSHRSGSEGVHFRGVAGSPIPPPALEEFIAVSQARRGVVGGHALQDSGKTGRDPFGVAVGERFVGTGDFRLGSA